MNRFLIAFCLIAFSIFGYSADLSIQGMPSLNIYSDTVSVNFGLGLGIKFVDLPFSIFNVPNDTINVNVETFFNYLSLSDKKYYNVGFMVLPSYSAKVLEINKLNELDLKFCLGVGLGHQELSRNINGEEFSRGVLLISFEGRLDTLYEFARNFYVGISLGYDVFVDPSEWISTIYSPKIGIPIIYEF